MFKANLLDILIVDTDKGLSDYLEKELRQRGLTVQTTDSPAVALAIVSEHIPRVILTDVEFAETPANEYLDALDQWSPTSVVIVHTHQLFAEVPNHVFEALRKPGKMESVVEASLRALEFQRELVQTLELEELHKREFVNRLTWLLWKRRSEARATLEHGRQIISNLRHSVAQGEGVGGMVTQMEILLMSKPDASGNRILKPDFADMLRESVTSVRAWLGSLERFSATRRLRYEGELLDSEDIRTLIEESLAIVEKFRRVGDQEIVVDPIRFEGRVLSSRAALGLTLRELLTNAFKYSPPGSCVNIAELRGTSSVSIAILNDPRAETRSMDLNAEAFMPFARTGHLYQDQYLEEELGLGIGLPVVQDAMQQLGGSVFLRHVQAHTDSVPRTRVLAEILLGDRQQETRPYTI